MAADEMQIKNDLRVPFVHQSIDETDRTVIRHPVSPRFVSQGSVAESVVNEVSKSNDGETESEGQPWWTYWHDMVAWKLVVARSIPNVLTMVCYMFNETVNVIAIGHAPNSTPAAQGAVGLGNMMQNVFGLSIALGLLGALDTLVPQAFGAGQHKLAASYIAQGRLLCAVVYIPMIPVMWYSRNILDFLGQDPLVALHAEEYNRPSLISFLPIFILEAARKFLYNVDRPEPALVVLVITSCLHILWVHLLVNQLELLNFGLGVANAITYTTSCVVLNLYLYLKCPSMGFDRSDLFFSVGSMTQIREFMQIGIPALFQSCSEWWYWEIIALIVGLIDATSLAAHVSMITTVGIIFMVCLGISMTASSLVGSAVGAGNPEEAKIYTMTTGSLSGVLWMLFIGPFLYLKCDLVAFVLTKDIDVRKLLEPLLQMYAIFGLPDHLACTLSGSVRSLGKVFQCARIYFMGNYCFMIPVGTVLGFYLRLGVYGVWLGSNIGSVLIASLMIRELNKINFHVLCEEAQVRIEAGAARMHSSKTDTAV